MTDTNELEQEPRSGLSDLTVKLERLPTPDCSYADHSYPAYSAKAMRDAIHAEREACAEIADFARHWIGEWEEKYGSASIAEAIRQRSNV